MSREKTEQEIFWMGEFGDDYILRNGGAFVLAAKVNVFSRYLSHASGVKTTLEFGGNIGVNEKALSILLPGVQMDVVEINTKAAEECSTIQNCTVYNESIYDFKTDKKYDLTFTSGVMIHLNPDMLHIAYEKLYDYSNKYILISEYYNPTPVTVEYWENNDKLFKRDFAGEMMDKYPDLELIDYGFIYGRALSIPVEDDMTYFLLRKAM